jgi:hypothetical protein
MSSPETLAIVFLVIIFSTIAVEFVIRAQVNSRLPLEDRISVSALRSVSTWTGPEGLLARHQRLYPSSRLAAVFRILWVLSLASAIAAVIYVKTN